MKAVFTLCPGSLVSISIIYAFKKIHPSRALWNKMTKTRPFRWAATHMWTFARTSVLLGPVWRSQPAMSLSTPLLRLLCSQVTACPHPERVIFNFQRQHMSLSPTSFRKPPLTALTHSEGLSFDFPMFFTHCIFQSL